MQDGNDNNNQQGSNTGNQGTSTGNQGGQQGGQTITIDRGANANNFGDNKSLRPDFPPSPIKQGE